MIDDALNERIVECGKQFFRTVNHEKVSVFDRQHWLGQIMDWCMKDPVFKVQLLRFIDLFPTLTSANSFQRHLEDYFGKDTQPLTGAISWGTQISSHSGIIGAKIIQRIVRRNILEMGRQFIVGESIEQALTKLESLRQKGFAFTLDCLGEATLNEDEAQTYLDNYLQLLESLHKRQATWPALNSTNDLDWEDTPKINISIKVTALCPHLKPQNFDASVEQLCQRLVPLVEKLRHINGHLCLDMEHHVYKEIIFETYRRLCLQFRDYPQISMAIQSYLRQSEEDLSKLLAWSQQHQVGINLRLVKGAYWDFEVIQAQQNNWPTAVYLNKHETDACFERMAFKILEHSDHCYLACASHNIRSIAAVQQIANQLQTPKNRFEFQILYGMAEPIRNGLLKSTHRVRLYAPYGQLIPGMAYLVRRLLENSSNDSFLRQNYAEHLAIENLLINPATQPTPDEINHDDRFKNQPTIDFSCSDQRRQFETALASTRTQLGKHHPLIIGDQHITTTEQCQSVNPAKPGMVVGTVSQATAEHVEHAVTTAKSAFNAWSTTAVSRRCHIIRTVATRMEAQRYQLAAMQVFEVGKQWDQAYGDVSEAIDFLRYYAFQMEDLAKDQCYGNVAGEINSGRFRAKGVTAVIAPWNFPLAISCGMITAALITGNTVIYKPSNLSPVVGSQLVELFIEAGLPSGVLTYLPCVGDSIGKTVVQHPNIHQIAFTGSLDVGLEIIEKAQHVNPNQHHIKHVVAEMGGKNAIIVDDDADLDEAVPSVVQSAFAYQGQKCSACSRVIVLEAIYDRFVERLLARIRDMAIGPAEDPGYDIGPVIDQKAVDRLLNAVEKGKKDATMLYYRQPADRSGYYPPVAVFGDVATDHDLAQRELFGPILTIMRAQSFSHAIELANSSRFALTAGVFSRSPSHLHQAEHQLLAGNIYLNRGITGALVGRQPFGGFQLSGLRTKAGGPDYLHHFMHRYCVTENTMRRGFAPSTPKSRT